MASILKLFWSSRQDTVERYYGDICIKTPVIHLEESKQFIKNENAGKKGGLSVTFAVMFIIGEMAGSGILALPRLVTTYQGSGFKGGYSLGADFSYVAPF